jgi:hypothetical protein
MYLRHIIITLLLCFCSLAQAYELILIQGVSSTKRSFITRNGKRQGIMPGVTGTFTAENVSILAKAINVSGSHTQWQVINSEAIFPFEKGAIVTYYPATEYLWALSPESERAKYIKTLMPKAQRSWVFKGAITRGLSESVSEAPATATTRGGYLSEMYYERGISEHFNFDVGLRYEREVVNYPGASFITKRAMLIGDLIYYFDAFREIMKGGKVYIGAGLGYGISNTSAVGLSQSGVVGMLPTVKLGLNLPFNDTWDFLIDNAFESLQTSEEQEDGRKQTTTQTNFKIGFGLRRYF